MDANLHISELAQRYCKARGVRETTVSVYAAGQAYAIARLRQGCTITIRRYARILQWFSDHWPEGEAWPTEIPRPAAKEATTVATVSATGTGKARIPRPAPAAEDVPHDA